MKAYFTVEAACILPIVLGIYILLIYGMFYRYDRCLLEQDTALMIMKEEETLSGRSADRYLAFQWQERQLSREIASVTARAAGKVVVPFGKLKEWTDENGWQLDVTFKKWDIDPTAWIRLYRKAMKGKEDASD